MKTIRSFAIASLLGLIPLASMAQTTDQAKIEAQLHRYQSALNTSDTAKVMALYDHDAVFMPQNYPTIVGEANVRSAYEAIFKKIKLDVTFTVAEVRVFSRDWAYARTNSAGTQVDLNTGKSSNEANQEVFLLHRADGGDWKFARYIFSTTNRPVE